MLFSVYTILAFVSRNDWYCYDVGRYACTNIDFSIEQTVQDGVMTLRPSGDSDTEAGQ